MEEDPFISVVMAAYNEEDVVSGAIESVLEQTYDNFEFIIVDDNSSDNTRKIIDQYDDPRIRLLENDSNKGLPASLNLGIKKANGDVIARMDADDRSTHDRFEKQISSLIDNPQRKVVGSRSRIINREGKKVVDITDPVQCTYTLDYLLQEGPPLAHGSAMIRSDALDEVNGYREKFRYAQDYDLWLRLAEEYGPDFMYIIPDILYERRIDSSQIVKRPLQSHYAAYARKSAENYLNGENDDVLLREMVEKADSIQKEEMSDKKKESRYQYLLAEWLYDQGKLESAANRFWRAVNLDPLHWKSWALLFISLAPNCVYSYISGDNS